MPAQSGPIVFFDSGVGGLPYLSAARDLLPHESFVYLADSASFPYGTKNADEIQSIVLNCIARIILRCSPKAIVIACNTASQAALEAVRAEHPEIPVIGTVPAIKPAAERTKTGVIGIMATARALADPYLDDLIARFAPGIIVLREAAQDLVSFVEHDLLDADSEMRLTAVRPHVDRLISGGADEIVIGCTHFLHVIMELAQAAGEGVGIVDSREGVARRLVQVMKERGIAVRHGDVQRGVLALQNRFFLSSMPPWPPEYASFAFRFGLEGPFPLDHPGF